jgi:DNA-binding CsgD family transcriptional regulator
VLVEREAALGALANALDRIRRSGQGELVFVMGEAGAGKTALLRALGESLDPNLPLLFGGCDSLRTPRPLAPLLDWTATADPSLGGAIAAGMPREQSFEAALGMLAHAPTVAVIEDVHWADEATLDLLVLLGRRIRRTSALLVVTYRSDEVGVSHPLSAVLGELATVPPLRVLVPPLSAEAVAALAAGSGVDAADLHRRTGGNAFYVTEWLASGDEDVPSSLREAVIGRTARLAPDERRAVEVVAASPGRTELWLAEELGASGAALDACISRGLLRADGSAISFRHELAREAVHDALLPHARQTLHQQVVHALVTDASGVVDHARVVHHAVEAGDAANVAKHAPLAAAAAARAGARVEAVAHLELALEHRGHLDADAELVLWGRLARERALLGRHDDAVQAFEQAIRLAARMGDDERRGRMLAEMWTPLSMSGRLDEAGAAATEATRVLERGAPSAALALAYAQRCAQHMLARELAQAEQWGRAAVRLADELDDHEVLAYALIQSGVAAWMAGDASGLARLRRGVDLAKADLRRELVAQGLSQIGSGGGEVRRYREAVPALEECVAFAERYQLGSRGLYAHAWLARCWLELGRWDEAAALLASLLRSPRCDGITRMTALTVLGRLRARRADPEVWAVLDEALELARRTGHLQRLWPVAAARAEAAWFDDRLADELDLVQAVYDVACRLQYPWAVGELGFWLWRAGATDRLVGAAEPYALHVGGAIGGAAAAWAAIGCPYERATALADSTADADQREAIVVFQELGASAALAVLVRRRRRAGLSVPRGPNAATKGNPAGLTDRELEVLRLVASGYTNPQIADQLQMAVKTAGTHVSNLLAKLGARSRAEAVSIAVERGVPLVRASPHRS